MSEANAEDGLRSQTQKTESPRQLTKAKSQIMLNSEKHTERNAGTENSASFSL